MPKRENVITSCGKKMKWRSFLHTCGILIILCGFVSTLGLASATDSAGTITIKDDAPNIYRSNGTHELGNVYYVNEVALPNQSIVANLPDPWQQYLSFLLGTIVAIILLILLNVYFIYKLLDLAKLKQELIAKIREQDSELKQAYQIIYEKSDLLSARDIEYSALEIELRNKYKDLLESKKELKESEKFHSSLFDAMQDMFYRLDENGVLTMVNKSFCKKCGYTSEDQVLGRNIDEFIRDATVHEKALDVLAKIGSVSDVPFQFVDIHGNPLYCILSLRMLYDQNGAVIGREGLARDATTEKSFENISIRQNVILSALKRTMHNGILIYDENRNIVAWNEQFAELHGIPPHEMPNITMSDIFVGLSQKVADFESFKTRIDEIDENKEIDVTDQMLFIDGTVIERHTNPIFDEHGVYFGRLWEFSDITERIYREQELQKALCSIEATNEELCAGEQELRRQYLLLEEQENVLRLQNSLLTALTEAYAHGVMVLDHHHKILMFNAHFFDIFDIDPTSVSIGDNSKEVTQACINQTDPSDNVEEIIYDVIGDKERIWSADLPLFNGKIIHVVSSPVTDKNGVNYGRIWEIRNITDTIKKQQELEMAYSNILQKDQQLSLALKGGGEGLWIWNKSDRLITLNPGFAEKYRFVAETQSIDAFTLAIHPDQREKWMDNVTKFFENETDPDMHLETEIQIQSNEGEWRWIIARGIVLADHAGSRLVTGTFVDITDRKKYEKSLNEAHRKVVILSQLTRHDILNQLSVLFAMNDALRDGTNPSQEYLLQIMEQALVTVQHQIEFTRDYQEIGTSGAGWQHTKALFFSTRDLLIRPPIELIVGDLPFIYADPLFEKAVYNLVENSLRHGKRTTEIRVTFSVENEGEGLLVLTDNGVGIGLEDKEKIFENGYGKNTGLGLFLVREILDITDITIHERGTPNVGARFEIRIPSGGWKWRASNR